MLLLQGAKSCQAAGQLLISFCCGENRGRTSLCQNETSAPLILSSLNRFGAREQLFPALILVKRKDAAQQWG